MANGIHFPILVMLGLDLQDDHDQSLDQIWWSDGDIYPSLLFSLETSELEEKDTFRCFVNKVTIKAIWWTIKIVNGEETRCCVVVGNTWQFKGASFWCVFACVCGGRDNVVAQMCAYWDVAVFRINPSHSQSCLVEISTDLPPLSAFDSSKMNFSCFHRTFLAFFFFFCFIILEVGRCCSCCCYFKLWFWIPSTWSNAPKHEAASSTFLVFFWW